MFAITPAPRFSRSARKFSSGGVWFETAQKERERRGRGLEGTVCGEVEKVGVVRGGKAAGRYGIGT